MANSFNVNSTTHPAASATAAFRQWRQDVPLCLLRSPSVHRPDSERIIMAEPRGWLIINHACMPERVGQLPDGFDITAIRGERFDPHAHHPLEQVNRLLDTAAAAEDAEGAWLVVLCYDLGRIIEPVAQHPVDDERATADRQWPLIAMAWCPDRVITDVSTGRSQFIGDMETVAAWFDDAHALPAAFDVQPLVSSLTETDYLDAVRRVIEKIAAGDIFQANLTQRFSSPFAGSTRELAVRAFAHSQPRYGAYMELPDGRCVVSMSPELFLDVNGRSRDVVTRPIKGTRPATAADAADVLRDSMKDQAELNMIVDLMRNDLGRVCDFGSIHVTEPRTIESHPTVYHGVSTIRGRLRDDVTIADLLRATFPGGSITGAPKIRAMQIIDEIEPVRRGPYCGSIGWIAPDQSARLNIAIRTISLTGVRAPANWSELTGTLDYGAGGGIVADSDPLSEYHESIDKAAVLRLALMPESAPAAPA